MASTGDVAARIRGACGKAEEARTALEQAEDLALDAHAVLAGVLTGVTHLESDTAAMLAEFTKVTDGCKGYLWPLLNEAVKAAESIAARLEGAATASPAPETRKPVQQSQWPPAGQSGPATPTVVPAERIEQLRRELPPPVVGNTGQKTHGRWIGPDGTVESIVSGRDEYAKAADTRLKEMGLPGPSAKTGDVEIKLAARMIEEGIRHATVLINNVPCVGRFGCDTLVPILLPEGGTLTVHGTTEQGERFRKRYTGGARPWWR